MSELSESVEEQEEMLQEAEYYKIKDLVSLLKGNVKIFENSPKFHRNFRENQLKIRENSETIQKRRFGTEKRENER